MAKSSSFEIHSSISVLYDHNLKLQTIPIYSFFSSKLRRKKEITSSLPPVILFRNLSNPRDLKSIVF